MAALPVVLLLVYTVSDLGWLTDSDPLKSAKEPVFLGHVRDKKAKRPSADEKAFLASRVVRGERPLLFFPQELLSPHEARGRNYLYGYRIQPVGELLSRSSIPKEEDHTAITVHNDGGSPATGAPSVSPGLHHFPVCTTFLILHGGLYLFPSIFCAPLDI